MAALVAPEPLARSEAAEKASLRLLATGRGQSGAPRRLGRPQGRPEELPVEMELPAVAPELPALAAAKPGAEHRHSAAYAPCFRHPAYPSCHQKVYQKNCHS
jgi:hypothetical protein